MKNQSAKAPALKDLLDKPLDLGYLELIEQTLRDAGINARWMFLLHKAFRSLKSYGSSPEHMMDLLSTFARIQRRERAEDGPGPHQRAACDSRSQCSWEGHRACPEEGKKLEGSRHTMAAFHAYEVAM